MDLVDSFCRMFVRGRKKGVWCLPVQPFVVLVISSFGEIFVCIFDDGDVYALDLSSVRRFSIA